MASVKKSDIPREAQMISMFWEMIKEFYIPENTQEYYKAFCKRAKEIDEQCHSRLAQKLILAFADYLDERERKL